jgi:hypothetical protein
MMILPAGHVERQIGGSGLDGRDLVVLAADPPPPLATLAPSEAKP